MYAHTYVVYFYLIPIFPTRCCGTPFPVLFGIVVQCYCILPPKVLTGSRETEEGCWRPSSPLPVLSSQFSSRFPLAKANGWLLAWLGWAGRRVYVLAVNGDWCPAGKFSAHKTLKYMANAAAEQLQQRRRRSKHTHRHTPTQSHTWIYLMHLAEL